MGNWCCCCCRRKGVATDKKTAHMTEVGYTPMDTAFSSIPRDSAVSATEAGPVTAASNIDTKSSDADTKAAAMELNAIIAENSQPAEDTSRFGAAMMSLAVRTRSAEQLIAKKIKPTEPELAEKLEAKRANVEKSLTDLQLRMKAALLFRPSDDEVSATLKQIETQQAEVEEALRDQQSSKAAPEEVPRKSADE